MNVYVVNLIFLAGFKILSIRLKVLVIKLTNLIFQYCEYYPDYEGCKKWLQKNLPSKFADLNIGAGGGGGGAAAPEGGEQPAEEADDAVSIFTVTSSV